MPEFLLLEKTQKQGVGREKMQLVCLLDVSRVYDDDDDDNTRAHASSDSTPNAKSNSIPDAVSHTQPDAISHTGSYTVSHSGSPWLCWYLRRRQRGVWIELLGHSGLPSWRHQHW
jgi:hypothetical protein